MSAEGEVVLNLMTREINRALREQGALKYALALSAYEIRNIYPRGKR